MPFWIDPQLSIVVPCFNEAEGIRAFSQCLARVLQGIAYTYEVVFVDDGSTDDTLTILNQIAMEDAHAIVLSLTRNFGHQIALTAGMDHARGRAVLVMDSDLQHPPELIPQMLAALETGVDIVYAVRQDAAQVGFLKRLTSQWFYTIINRWGGTSFLPGAADFRLMSPRAVDAIRQMREQHRFLRGLVAWTGFPSSVIPYSAQPRRSGKSKYSWPKMFRLALDAIFSFSVLPLRIVTLLGLIMVCLGLVYLIYVLIGLFLWRDQVQPGWPSLLASLLLLSGVQLLSLGVIAMYVGMIFEQVKQRPLYFLKQSPPDEKDRS